MAPAISPTTLRRFDIRGFHGVDPERLAHVASWLRLTLALCAALAVTATAFASLVLPLPRRGRTDASGMLIASHGSWRPRCWSEADTTLRGTHSVDCSGRSTLVSTTDICIPSLLYRMVFGWPPSRTSEQPAPVR